MTTPHQTTEAAGHTPGPWYWHTDHAGNVSLRTPDRGNLIVMDFVRSGMQGATARLAYWKGLPGGVPRERMGGVMDKFNAEHPDAALIAAAPMLHAELASTQKQLAGLREAVRLAGRNAESRLYMLPLDAHDSERKQLETEVATYAAALKESEEN